MPIRADDFKKLEKRAVKGIICTCNAKVIVSAEIARCWKCRKVWRAILDQKIVIQLGRFRQKKCKILSNWMTNRFGQCKRKEACEAQGRKCQAIDKFTLPIVVLQ